jgi:uncharacterized RDD family membrane protein YckC/DNA-directed RNA polymerase subunit M/transcription elongation factor TFIIS
MPIKVRCGQCKSVLNVSEKAAGRVVLCKSCGGKVRVPADAAEASGAGSDSEKPRRPSKSEAAALGTGDELFRGLNLNKAEDTKRKVCPGCASPVNSDEIECKKCGVNIQTGALSERQRLRLARKGPPPAEFYGAVWGNSWKFLMKNKGIVLTTALVWTITLTMSVVSLYSRQWCIDSRTKELTDSAKESANNIEITDTELIITVDEEGKGSVRYDDFPYSRSVRLPSPRIAAIRSPPAIFWLGMTIVFQLGFGGWAWMLAVRIAELTLANEKKIKRFQIDFFANLTMGFRFYFWPVVVMLPFIWIGPFLMQRGMTTAGAIVTGITLLVPMLFFLPAAVIHMTQRYGYRAWLINWMTLDFLRTVGSTLYIAGMMCVLVLAIPAAVAGTLYATRGRLIPYLENLRTTALKWYSDNVSNFEDGGLAQYAFAEFPMLAMGLFLVFGVICLIISFPSVFMMRVIGMYGMYFRADLAIVGEFPDKTPAGFGPRMLAFLVDLIILVLIAVPAFVFGFLGSWMGTFYGLGDYAEQCKWVMRVLGTLGIWSYYFASGESGQTRSTLGKWSLGLVVLREDDRPMSRKQAFQRAWVSYLTILTLFIGFIMVAFRRDHRALHDQLTKTKVLWRGEELT